MIWCLTVISIANDLTNSLPQVYPIWPLITTSFPFHASKMYLCTCLQSYTYLYPHSYTSPPPSHPFPHTTTTSRHVLCGNCVGRRISFDTKRTTTTAITTTTTTTTITTTTTTDNRFVHKSPLDIHSVVVVVSPILYVSQWQVLFVRRLPMSHLPISLVFGV